MVGYILNLLILVSISGILAASLNFIIGYAGIYSMAHAAFFGIAAYTGALIALHVAGALYHCFFLKDQLLTRMFFGKRAIAAATISASPALKRPLSKVQS